MDSNTIAERIEIPKDYTPIPNDRYEQLLDAETRLQMVDDLFRANGGYISVNQLYAVIGFNRPKFGKEVNIGEEN